MSALANTTAEHPAFAAYVCTEQGADLARSVFEASGTPASALMGGGLSRAARVTVDFPAARMLLTELGNMPVETACESVSIIRRTGADVIVFGHNTDIQTYRALRKAGALDYFPMPCTAQDILSVEIEVKEPANIPGPVPSTTSVLVVGTNGGVGASALSESLARIASSGKATRTKTALLDADLQFGSVALDLDRESTPGLLDALTAPDRVDPTFLSSTMDRITENLSIYSHQGTLDAETEAVRFPALFERLKTEFDTVVIDAPRTLILSQPEVLQQVDAIVVLIPSGFAGVSAATRLIAHISAKHPDLRILPVLSEARKDAKLSAKDIAKVLDLELATVLPRCDAQIARAQRKGKTMAELYPRSPYTKAVQSLWSKVTKDQTQPMSIKTGFLKSVFL